MVDSLSPQEDEFALLALGVPSVYRSFIDPRRIQELTRWLDPNSWIGGAPNNWTDDWLRFLGGVAAGRLGRLVLKSPNHTFRVRNFDQIFPSASIAWLVRDPIDTFLSNRKMWLAMFQRYALWFWDHSLLDDFLCEAMEHAAECLTWATRRYEKNQLVVVKFEQLSNAPLKTLEDINSRLSLGKWPEMKTAVGLIATARTDYRHEKYPEARLSGAILTATGTLRLAQQSALASHGF